MPKRWLCERSHPPLCPEGKHRSVVELAGSGLSVNRPFLPLLQMSESETLISMVNRMVENSSPRAQLFVQVRPLPGSMVPVNTISAACAWSGRPIGMRLPLPNVFICQASSPRDRLDLLFFPSLPCVTSILHIHG